MAAQESGLELDENYREEDIFELQHHHLLRCLEKTTVSKLNSVYGFLCSSILVILYFYYFLHTDEHVLHS
jgi:potassium voltage-gated channel Shal-related subfamily D protein